MGFNFNNQIALVGDIALDTNVFLSGTNNENSNIENYPTKQILMNVGGCVVNHSKSMIANGVQPEIISLFSNDYIGKMMLQELENYKISTRCLFPILNINNKTVLLVSPNGNKKIFSEKSPLPPQNLIEKNLLSLISSFNYIHFSLNSWNKPLIKKILQSNPNAQLSVDLQLNINNLDKEIISRIKIVFFSGAEIKNHKQVIENILSMGAEIVICTIGENGCLIGQKNKDIKQYRSMKQNKPIIDTVGAGDVFAATFLCEYYRNQPIGKAVIKATIQAGKSCVSYGLDNLYTTSELEQEFRVLKSMSF